MITKQPQSTPNIIKITYFQKAVLYNQKSPPRKREATNPNEPRLYGQPKKIWLYQFGVNGLCRTSAGGFLELQFGAIVMQAPVVETCIFETSVGSFRSFQIAFPDLCELLQEFFFWHGG